MILRAALRRAPRDVDLYVLFFFFGHIITSAYIMCGIGLNILRAAVSATGPAAFFCFVHYDEKAVSDCGYKPLYLTLKGLL